MKSLEMQIILNGIASLAKEDRIYTHRGAPTHVPLRCTFMPEATWSPDDFQKIGIVDLPEDLVALWNHTSGLRLFEDFIYGQWGLVIWSPAEVIEHFLRIRSSKNCELQSGDLVIGEFLGDSDLLIIRCDATLTDFGTVTIALPIDPPSEWFRLNDALSAFLKKYLSYSGDKFWEIK